MFITTAVRGIMARRARHIRESYLHHGIVVNDVRVELLDPREHRFGSPRQLVEVAFGATIDSWQEDLNEDTREPLVRSRNIL